MKNETICECGHLKEVHACSGKSTLHHNDAWCEAGDCTCRRFTTGKSLRDEMFENCETFELNEDHQWASIELSIKDNWHIWSVANEKLKDGFATPEAAFAWLKDHLKEQK